MRGEIHNGFCAHIYGCHYLFNLDIIILAIAGNTEIYVDLGAEHRANAVGINAGM